MDNFTLLPQTSTDINEFIFKSNKYNNIVISFSVEHSDEKKENVLTVQVRKEETIMFSNSFGLGDHLSTPGFEFLAEGPYVSFDSCGYEDRYIVQINDIEGKGFEISRLHADSGEMIDFWGKVSIETLAGREGTIIEFNDSELGDLLDPDTYQSLDEELSELISDKTGFCHKGFRYKIVIDAELDKSE